MVERILTGHPAGVRPTVFLETGTFEGMTAMQMAAHLPVVSVEINPQYVRHARRRVAGYANICILEGDSAVLLPQLLAVRPVPCLIYLDAHTPNAPHPGDPPIPLAAELAACVDRRVGDTVVIDDVKTFGHPYGWEWVSVDSVVERLQPLAWEVMDDHLLCWMPKV